MDREKIILDAAVRVFSRYGVKRSSMHDLASEAGVSRQTLYNAFSSKNDILRRLIRVYADEGVDEIRSGLGAAQGLSERLDLAFRKIALEPYDLIASSPNAEDIVEGFNASSQQELAVAEERFRSVIEEILKPYEASLAAAGFSLPALSDFVQRSAKAAKKGARDRDHLVQLLGTLRDMCLVVVGEKTGREGRAGAPGSLRSEV
ncbi:TetR/AcrR family transcriptional regulator [Aliiruegeria haliotis]|nr:TetR/AcrR family transcriptional regulator [Aliiruegeria haliotis]